MLTRSTLLLTLAACVDKSRLYSDDDGGSDDTAAADTGSETGFSSRDDEDGDGYTADEDCDDSNPEVHPGADEICDGLDNDCDTTTPEDGMVRWVGRNKSTEDLSALFATGTEASPIVWMGSTPGDLHICESSFFAQLVILESIAVSGHAGATVPSLNAGNGASVITIDGAGLIVSVESLLLTGGQGSFDSRTDDQMIDAGGGIACAGRNSLQLSQVTILGNDAQIGGGLYLEECTLEADETQVNANEASFSGGIHFYNSSATLQNSAIEANRSTESGGGFTLTSSGTGPVEVVLRDTLVSSNRGVTGGAQIEQGSLVCEGTIKTSAGFLANIASSSRGTGGVLIAGDSSLVSQECDWGGQGSAGDNSPQDVSSSATNYGDDESFVCTVQTCI
jgi:hypothetical protein